jgi:CHAD domain-containing protein
MSRKIRRTKSGDLNQCLKGLQKTLRTGAGGASDGRSDRLMHTLFNGAFRKVVLLRRQIRRDDPATIHRMRVAFKRFRYTAEFLQPFLPHFTKERIARMKEFQAAAGNIQDVAVLLERMAKDIKTGDVKPAWVKNLRSELLRRERRAIDSFMARIDELMDFEPERPASFTTEPEAVSE